ncbi:MAG: ABC transporter permease [Roseburia sp.]
MIQLIYRKIRNKKWMNLCLFTGITLLVAVFSCHPMLEEGSNDRLLATAFQEYAKKNQEFPAVFSRAGSYETADYSTAQSVFGRMDAYEKKWTEYVEVDSVVSQQSLKLSPSNAQSNLGFSDRFLGIGLLRDMDAHMEIVKGEGLDADTKEGCFPCVISESVMDATGLVVGEEITFSYAVNDREEPAKFVVSGIFRESSDEDNYWYHAASYYERQIFVSEEVFDTLMAEYGYGTVAFEDNLLLNYTQINHRNAEAYLNYIKEFRKADTAFQANFIQILEKYQKESRTVRTILWVLELPCVVLLLLFIYMVSGQVVQSEEQEIAMLRSRGVTRGQTVWLYVLQSLILSGGAMFSGLLLGFAMCKFAAKADAFLQFANKDASLYRFSWKMIPFALAACIIATLFMTFPVWKKSKITIVEQKSAGREVGKNPLWERAFLDLILLGISCYLLYNYRKQSGVLSASIIAGDSLDPMIFLNASLFIFSCGLVFLRLTKYLIMLVDNLGKKRWNCAMYASFLQIRRTFHKQSFISVFLIMTIAMGIFQANMARTMNENNEARICYNVGADLRLQQEWKMHVYRSDEKISVTYEEPDFQEYAGLVEEGICDSITRVIEDSSTDVVVGSKKLSACQLMGIHTKEFGETAELMDGLNETHWFYALNALAEDVDGVIISRNAAEALDVSVGDSINYMRYSPYFSEGDDPLNTAKANVCAIVDSFPGYERYHYVYNSDGELEEQENYLIVANYATVIDLFGMTPYHIWMKLFEGESSEQVADYMEEKKLESAQWQSLEEELEASKSSALIQITNGMFTMGFLISILICSVGFLIYWVMAMKQRELLFGIYRAMGMRMSEIRYMLVNEQIFGSVLPILAGGGVGAISTCLFVRLIALVYLPKKHNIAIRIYLYGADMMKLFVVIFLVMVLCAFILRGLLKNMKIAQALKLGED